VGAVLGGLEYLPDAHVLVDTAGHTRSAVLGAVEQTKLDGVHPQLGSYLVQDSLSGKCRLSGARRAVVGGTRFVHHHVISVDARVRDVVWCEHAACTRKDGRPRIRARLVTQLGHRRGDAAVAPSADGDAHPGAASRAGSQQCLFAGHHHAHGATALAGQDGCSHVDVAGVLAAKAAPHLCGNHADFGRGML